MRILLVEDEAKIASFIQRGLKEEKYVVDCVDNGNNALYQLGINTFDLIILDIMLPGKDGISICKEIRKNGILTPVLMVTARNSIEDKVLGLDVGADDYLTKPFVFEEFLARVRALLRRNQSQKSPVLKIADLELNQLTHQVFRAGKVITVTSKEYALLEYLLIHAGQVITRTMISEHVWNEDFDSFTNIIDVYIRYLRNKIDKDFACPLIHTIRGTGYMLSEVAP